VTNSKVPFVSDIPWFGRLFVSGDQERRRTDVLISLTPRIVKVMERPDPEIESFRSGTADSGGASTSIVPGATVSPPSGPGASPTPGARSGAAPSSSGAPTRP
jgi:general secretion pathway protein D